MFFLTAILPQVLPPLGVAPAATLEVGGLVLFASGLAIALGSLATPRLGDLLGERWAVVGALGVSSLLLALLPLARDVWSFTAIRALGMAAVAPVFPLSVAAIASRASGQAIGFVNSARIGASFLGPVVATMLLTWAPPGAVYLALAAPGLAVAPWVARAARRPYTREGGDS